MTNPFSIDKWAQAGWKPPTPHQVLAVMMAAATAMPLLGIVPSGSLSAKLCELLSLVCGGMGINAARLYQSPQVIAKLQAVDARALKPTAQTNIYAANGTDINVAAEQAVVEPAR